MQTVLNSIVVITFITVLSACGGGEGDAATGDPDDMPIGQAPATVQQFAALFNVERAESRRCGDVAAPATHTLSKWNPRLQQAAQAHADDMNSKGYFSHNGLDGSTSVERAANAGYKGTPAGENLARGSTDPQYLTSAWMGSPGHCFAIMNPDANALAVAQSGPYTVMMTGR